MIALFGFNPRYCPVCGHAIKTKREDKNITHECAQCGLRWQKAAHEAMLAAADISGGDLREWA